MTGASATGATGPTGPKAGAKAGAKAGPRNTCGAKTWHEPTPIKHTNAAIVTDFYELREKTETGECLCETPVYRQYNKLCAQKPFQALRARRAQNV